MIRHFAALFLILAGCSGGEERALASECPMLGYVPMGRDDHVYPLEIDSLPTSFERATGGFSTDAWYVNDTLRAIIQTGLEETGRMHRFYHLLSESSYLITESEYRYTTRVSPTHPLPMIADSAVEKLYVCKGAVEPRSRWSSTSPDAEDAQLRELIASFPRPSNVPK